MNNNETKKERFIRLLRSTKRKGVEKLITYIEESDFFYAPASTKFHLSCKEGLLIHSLQVYDEFKRLTDREDINVKLDYSGIILVSLLHDINKINTYKPNILKNGERSTYKPYEFNGSSFPCGHGEKSVIILLQLGLELSELEILCIRWHMNVFDKNYYQYQDNIKKECPESIYLFISDYLATLGES